MILAVGLLACAALTPFLRFAGDPEEFALTNRDTWRPNYGPYLTILREEASDTGDFEAVLRATEIWKADRRQNPYDPDALYEDHATFTYTPVPAMLVYPLAGRGLSVSRAADIVHVANQVLCLIGGTLLFLLFGYRRRFRRTDLALFIFAFLTYYPLAKALELTQAQVWIWTFLVVSAFLLQRKQHSLSGVFLGVAMCIKPHLVVIPILLTFATGFPRRVVLSSVGTGAALAGLSLAWVGHETLHYYATEMLPTLSAGYAYHPNQSLSGVLLRLGEYAPAAEFKRAPGVPWVRLLSAAFGMTIFLSSLVALRRYGGRENQVMALGLAILAATLISPITWSHHLTVLSISFCVVGRYMIHENREMPVWVRWTALLSFLFIASYFDTSRLDGFPLALFSAFGLCGMVLLYFCLVNCLRNAHGRV